MIYKKILLWFYQIKQVFAKYFKQVQSFAPAQKTIFTCAHSFTGPDSAICMGDLPLPLYRYRRSLYVS